ncbi:PadR family transcriptional regulator [Bifidobacterium callimiconis]|uniref:PadR family transcriptional regulator n=1 Tax=Bifidobacterium callimiconis TaxID=2306973 RepID=A0A430FI89_9BIFI|nr:PadR family transcriptional regulator [Bifidobacterium callimiconis]RSX52520.1 PadR family transcriptional regulator [Bifidobacterium callimiconis]
MAIKEALLALLQRSPASAYQLKKEFDATTSETWPLNIGQVSTTLQRLQRDGLIEQCPDNEITVVETTTVRSTNAEPYRDKVATPPNRAATATRTKAQPTAVWQLTDTGREAVSQWWSTPVTLEQRGRDELVMKLAFAVTTPGVDVTALIQRQRVALQRLLHDVTRARRALPPSDVAGLLVLDHHIFATEAELRWLDTIDDHRLRARL